MNELAKALDSSPVYKSRLESKYADRLELLRRAGEIRTWRYEPMRFRLAKAQNYTPDFLVITPDGTLELHEVKGWSQSNDRSRAAWKGAAERNPWFRWAWCTWNKKDGWKIEHYLKEKQ